MKGYGLFVTIHSVSTGLPPGGLTFTLWLWHNFWFFRLLFALWNGLFYLIKLKYKNIEIFGPVFKHLDRHCILQQQVLSNQPAQPWPSYGYPAPGYAPDNKQLDSANGQMYVTPVATMQNYTPNTLLRHNLSNSGNNFDGLMNYQQPEPN